MYYATSNVVAAFLILGVLGKKMAVVGRKTDSVTVIDVLRARYKSNALSYICAVVILVFFTTQIGEPVYWRRTAFFGMYRF